MKKLRVMALFLMVVMLLGTVAMAAETTGTPLENTKKTVSFTPVNLSEEAYTTTSSVEFGTVNGNPSEEKVSVTVNSAALDLNEQVLVLMCKYKKDGTPDVTDSNIYYIDQKVVEVEDTITFDVYPSYMKDSYIYISGVADGLVKAILVDGLVIGDINGDGTVNIQDVMAVANMMMGRAEKTSDADLVSDGTGNISINIQDVMAVANIMMGRTN